MRIGIVGYQGAGKSKLFEWLTGVAADPAKAHESQAAMAVIRDPRVRPLCDIYRPKKVTEAALEIVDTPGLTRSHEGSAQKLALIREAGCLVIVVGAFGGANAAADLQGFDDDLLLADLEIVSGRVERLRDQVKKPRSGREEQEKELHALEPVQAALEGGQRLCDLQLTVEQQRAIRSFQLFSDKPRFVVFNIGDDQSPDDYRNQVRYAGPSFVGSLSLQLDLERLAPDERDAFCQEMGVVRQDREELIRALMDASGQMLFFTAGEKEVRTWLIRKGGTAVEAAGGIHTDLAKGFIRAEVMTCRDLVAAGSERDLKAQGLLRHEHKDYVIQDGDILLIRHS